MGPACVDGYPGLPVEKGHRRPAGPAGPDGYPGAMGPRGHDAIPGVH